MGPIGVNVVVQGVLAGLVYALMGLGFTVIFRSMRVVNFAHGALTMLATVAAFLMFRTAGVDPLLAFILIAAVFFGLGYLSQRLLIHPFLRRPRHQQFLFLVGLAIVVTNGLVLIFGPGAHAVELSYGSGSYPVGPVALDKIRLFAGIAALACAAGVLAFLRFTRIGTAIRACAENPLAAAVAGLDVERLYAVAFGIGLACVGAAGALLMGIADAGPGLSSSYTLLTFAVVLIGGLGSLAGALVGGVLVGIAEASAGIFIAPSMGSVFVVGLLIAVLVLRPQGLFGFRA